MRMKDVKIEVFNDVVGKPYVIISGTTEATDGCTDAPALDIKMWAETATVVDRRKQ